MASHDDPYQAWPLRRLRAVLVYLEPFGLVLAIIPIVVGVIFWIAERDQRRMQGDMLAVGLIDTAWSIIRDAREARPPAMFQADPLRYADDLGPRGDWGERRAVNVLDRMGVTFVGRDLSRINLLGANLSGETFEKANLSGAALSVGDFSRVRLSGANLRNAVMFGTNLARAWLDGADLGHADARGADLTETALHGANFANAHLSCSVLRQSVAIRTSFRNADLRDADLRFAKLDGSDLAGASLDGADLDHADLKDIDLSTATGLTQAQVDGACSNGGLKMPPGLRPPPECSTIGPGDVTRQALTKFYIWSGLDAIMATRRIESDCGMVAYGAEMLRGMAR